MYVHQMTEVCKIVLYRSICICIIQVCVKSRSGDYPYTGVAPADFAAQSVAGLARGSPCPVFSPPNNTKKDQEKIFATFSRGLASVQSFPNPLCFMPWLKWEKNCLNKMTQYCPWKRKDGLKKMVYRNPYDGYSEEGGGYSCQEEYAGCREPDSQYYTHQAQVNSQQCWPWREILDILKSSMGTFWWWS